MQRFRRMVLPGLTALAVGFGCSGSREEGSDGTVVVERTEASAIVAGRFEGIVETDVKVSVNEIRRTVVIAPDRTFVVREVPSGDVTLTIEVAGVRGFITITDVQAAELIEVVVTVTSDSLVITITRRTLSSGPPLEVNVLTGDPLVIDANNICYFLVPGVYQRDIIVRGNHVSLFGAASCVEGQRTILDGTLRIEGNNALVQDVALRGSVIVTGNRARIQDTCSECFADSCLSNGDTCGTNCEGGTGNDGEPPIDASADNG